MLITLVMTDSIKYRKFKLRVCPVCDKNPITQANASRCRSCTAKEVAKKLGYSTDRTEMLAILETGKYTLEQVSRQFGLSRQRVNQIWKKNMGSGYHKRIERSGKIRSERREKFLDSIFYVCLKCKKEVSYRENRVRPGWVYCKDCRDLLNNSTYRNYRIVKVCQTCGRDFHPFSNYKSPSSRNKSIFCSMKCYFNSPVFLMHMRGVAKKFDKEKLIDITCEFIKKNNRVPRFKEVNTRDLGFSNGTVYRNFKNLGELWNKAYLKLEDK